MEDRKIKNRLVASLMFLLLGGCASGLFSHGDDEAISYSETRMAEKRHTEEARKGLMRDRKEKLDLERTGKMMAEQARKAETNKQAAVAMMTKIKEKRMKEMESQNKGRSLQEMVAAFMAKKRVLKPKEKLSWSDLSEKTQENIYEKIDYVLSRYNLRPFESDFEGDFSDRELLENKGLDLFVGAAQTGKEELVAGNLVETVFEELVKRESLRWVRRRVLGCLKSEEGFKVGTRLAVKKIDLKYRSLGEMKEKELLTVIDNIFECKNLTDLNLSGNDFGESTEVCKRLANGISNSNLKKLNLSNNLYLMLNLEGLKILGEGIAKSKVSEFTFKQDCFSSPDKDFAAEIVFIQRLGNSENLKLLTLNSNYNNRAIASLEDAGFARENETIWRKKSVWKQWFDSFSNAFGLFD